jgi:hypothetical protein
MRVHRLCCRFFLTLSLLAAARTPALADQYGFSSYALGESAFSAGLTPPPGTYVTAATGFYSAKINSTLAFDTVTLNAGDKIDIFTNAWNLLYVPNRKLFGGNLGIAVTIPVSYVDYDATIGVGRLQTSLDTNGWGLGDVIPRAQLGWQQGEFAHTVYLEVITPSGFWKHGFAPITGLHRPGIDTGWAFTWTDKPTKLQVSGTAGFTFNFENTASNYQSGTDFHWEWAVGYEWTTGLVLGVVGYDYRQLTGDSGSGARLGPFEGSVDAVGAALSYTTLVDKTPLIFDLRYYHEYEAKHRFLGDTTLASATIRF